MKVEQMENTRGNKVDNQFVIQDGEKIVFQSYNSLIVEVDFNKKAITIGPDYNYSTTTGKYRNLFFTDYVYLPNLNTLRGLESALKEGSFGAWTIKRGIIQ